jgi:hypothetical protein
MTKRGEMENHTFMEIPWTDMLEEDQQREDVKAYLKSVAFFKKKYGEKSFFFQEEFCCIASDESVAIFTHAMLQKCIEIWQKYGCQFRDPTGHNPVYVGIDIGRFVDSTVVIALEDMGEYVQIIGIWEMTNIPFPEQEIRIERILRDLKATGVRIDHTAMGMNTAEKMQKIFGAKVELVDFNLPSKEKLVIDAYATLQTGKIAIPPREDSFGETLYEQMHNVRRDRTASGNIKYAAADEGIHDDFQWAFCLALSYIAIGEASGGMVFIGAKETHMITSTPERGVEVKITRDDKTLQYAVGSIDRDQLERERVLDERKRKEWTQRENVWSSPQSQECIECKKNGTLEEIEDPRHPGLKVKRPVRMYRIGKPEQNSSEYICEQCHSTPRHENRRQCTIDCQRQIISVRKK